VLRFGGRGAGKRKKAVLKTGELERQVTYFSLFPKWLKELCSSSTTLFYMYTWEEYRILLLSSVLP